MVAKAFPAVFCLLLLHGASSLGLQPDIQEYADARRPENLAAVDPEQRDLELNTEEHECNWTCYLDAYPDLKAAFHSDLEAAQQHYESHGKAEKRDCTCQEANCDWNCYLDAYPDLKAAFGSDVVEAHRHYDSRGKAEGRDCTCQDGNAVPTGASMKDDPRPAGLVMDTPELPLPMPPQATAGQLAELEQKVKRKRIAVAWHGLYNRRGHHGHVYMCSDFFHTVTNLKPMVLAPLEAAGAVVKHYVHTYHRADCPARDQDLLNYVMPVRFGFWDPSNHRIVDSSIEVLKLVQLDSANLDHVLLMRFDVSFLSPIWDLNITWDKVNLPNFCEPGGTDQAHAVSDLFYTLPSRVIPEFIAALDESGNHGLHGSGHFVYNPLAESLGEDQLNIIDERFGSARVTYFNTMNFLGIDRTCAEDYYASCPEVEHTWEDFDRDFAVLWEKELTDDANGTGLWFAEDRGDSIYARSTSRLRW